MYSLTLSATLLSSAWAAASEGEQAPHPFLRPDFRTELGNYSPYARTYQFPVYYPSFQHSEEEESLDEAPVLIPYKHTSVNVFTSSDSENNYSSVSNDYSGPSFSSRSGDSASSSGSDSGKYTLAGDSASDYIESVSSSSDHGHSWPGDSSFESEDSDYSSTSGSSTSTGGTSTGGTRLDGAFTFDIGRVLGAAGDRYHGRAADAYNTPPQQYVDLNARCARVDFDWNFLGIGGTMDLYQPAHGELLVDVDFNDLQRDSRYGLAIHTLPVPATGFCDINTSGPTLKDGWLGSFVTDRKGRGSVHTYKDLDLDDLLGMSVLLQPPREDYALRLPVGRSMVAGGAAQTGQTGSTVGYCKCGPHIVYAYDDTSGVETGVPLQCPDSAPSCTTAECIAGTAMTADTCATCTFTEGSDMFECDVDVFCPIDPGCGSETTAGNICPDTCSTFCTDSLQCPRASVFSVPACGTITEVPCPTLATHYDPYYPLPY